MSIASEAVSKVVGRTDAKPADRLLARLISTVKVFALDRIMFIAG